MRTLMRNALAVVLIAAVLIACGGDDDAVDAGTADGGIDDCYSPTQNLDIAYTQGAIGCPCAADEDDECIDGVALICDGARWQAVEDGPCEPRATGCGARLGDTCTDDEYCAYVPEQLCGAADASATCRPRPTACDAILDPVCGCDGNTYSNACEANAAGTGLLADEECD